jgi:hypothetical protein
MRPVVRIGFCGAAFRAGMLAVAFAAWMPASESFAARPEVEFDAASLVSAEDVTTAAFRAAHPGEKLIAVRVEISSLVRRGNAADLAEVLYRVEAGDREMLVFDFAPKTTLSPLAAGTVAVERDTDAQTQLRANVAGRYFPFAEGDAAFAQAINEQTRLRYELPAPQEVLVTAGSTQRRRGVFVKLRASRRGSLEGAKAVAVLFVVPQNWRGGVVHVEAEARSTVGGVLGKDGEAVVCGTASLATGVHLAGDLAARDAVERPAAEKAGPGPGRKRDREEGVQRSVRDAFDDVFVFAVRRARGGESIRNRRRCRTNRAQGDARRAVSGLRS